MKLRKEIDPKGTIRHYNEKGKLHREDGPAVERANGNNVWYQNGKRHREDGPAIEWANGDKWWYRNGKRHREDGPAVECANGTKMWYLEGRSYTEKEYWEKVEKERLKKPNYRDILRKYNIGGY